MLDQHVICCQSLYPMCSTNEVYKTNTSKWLTIASVWLWHSPYILINQLGCLLYRAQCWKNWHRQKIGRGYIKYLLGNIGKKNWQKLANCGSDGTDEKPMIPISYPMTLFKFRLDSCNKYGCSWQSENLGLHGLGKLKISMTSPPKHRDKQRMTF